MGPYGLLPFLKSKKELPHENKNSHCRNYRLHTFALVGNAYAQDPDRSPVLLGAAGRFVILTEAGITDVPTSAVTGDVGTSPITGAADLLTCTEVTGTIYSVDAAGPFPCSVMDPTLLTAAVLDMQPAYTDAAGRTKPDFIESGQRKYWRVDTRPWPLQMGHQCKNTNGCHYLGCFRRCLDLPDSEESQTEVRVLRFTGAEAHWPRTYSGRSPASRPLERPHTLRESYCLRH